MLVIEHQISIHFLSIDVNSFNLLIFVFRPKHLANIILKD